MVIGMDDHRNKRWVKKAIKIQKRRGKAIEIQKRRGKTMDRGDGQNTLSTLQF